MAFLAKISERSKQMKAFDFGSHQNLEGRLTAYDFRAECLTWHFWRIISDYSEDETVRTLQTDESQTNLILVRAKIWKADRPLMISGRNVSHGIFGEK